jgi:hypothetical protein
MARTTKAPIEVTGLRKTPAIVVNRGDWIHEGTGWYEVVDYASPGEGLVVIMRDNPDYPGDKIYWSVHVDRIEEWRKG